MTELPSNLLAFPSTARSSCSADLSASRPLAEAEMRAEMIRNLLRQLLDNDGVQTLDLRARLLSYAAQELLDDMVVLYRQALGASSAHA
jgi:ribosomal protein L17